MDHHKLQIIFEDENLLVVDKPAGLVSTPSETQAEGTLADILNKEHGVQLDRGGLVHRLDKDTSGLILAAKTQEIFDGLQAQFKDRTVKKEYLALVHGVMEQSGKIEAKIGRNPINREKFTVMDEGREATTLYTLEKHFEMKEETIDELFSEFNKIQRRKLKNLNYGKFSLVRCFPETGRTHQIRVHLKHIGFSIVGDEKYGGRKVVRLDHRWCPRQFLHAARISFIHPKTGEKLEFESPLPEDLEKALSFLYE